MEVHYEIDEIRTNQTLTIKTIIMLSEIKPKVLNAIARIGNIDEIEIYPLAVLSELGFDSLDLVELLMEIEKQFDIKIPDTVANDIKTVNDLIQTVYQIKLNNKNLNN